jgi:chromosome segregation ATPase
MSLVDTFQNLIFKSKKPKTDLVETDAVGKITSEAVVSKKEGPRTEIVKTSTAGQEMNVKELQEAMQLQEIQIQKLIKQKKDLEPRFEEYKQGKRSLEENEKSLKKQEKKYLNYFSQTNLVPQQKEQLRSVLREVQSQIAKISEGKNDNEKFIRNLRNMSNEIDKAIKINERALSENKKILLKIQKSKDAYKLIARGTEDVEKEIASEIPEKEVENIEKPIEKLAQSQIPASETSESSPIQSDDDYWTRGKID